MSFASLASPADRARHVIGVTARAWRVAPASPRAIARRAPHGYVPQRAWRRLKSLSAALSAPAPISCAR